jgi:hypothetical protein
MTVYPPGGDSRGFYSKARDALHGRARAPAGTPETELAAELLASPANESGSMSGDPGR